MPEPMPPEFPSGQSLPTDSPGFMRGDRSSRNNWNFDVDPALEAAEREIFEQTNRGSEYDKGRVVETLLARHPDSESVRYGLRVLQLSEERFDTNGEPDNRWEVSHRFRTLADREMVLKMPLEDLFKRRFVERLTDEELEKIRSQRGRTIPETLNENFLAKSLHVDGFGLQTFAISEEMLESYEKDADGKMKNLRFRLVPRSYVYVGTEKERKEGSGEFGLLKDEVSARKLMMDMWGHHVTYYYALQKLAEGAYFGTTLSAEGVGILFNLKGQDGAKTETMMGVKVDSLGKKIDIAMRLLYVTALSEKPTRLKKLMETPGWKQFMFPDGTEEQFKKLIGEPDKWEKELEAGGNRAKDTLYEERKGGLRGPLTRRNIFAEVDTNDENIVMKTIEEVLGGGENASFVDKIEAETARRIAYRLFRLFLLADQEGYELLKTKIKGDKMNPYDGVKVVFSNAPQASDFGKLTRPGEYGAKSREKGRDYMPPGSFLYARKYYSRFMVDFLRHASAHTEIKVKAPKGEGYIVEERSLMERWWGYRGGLTRTVMKDKDGKTNEKIVRNKIVEDIEPGEIEYLDEPAVQLSDLSWASFTDSINMSEEDAAMLSLPVGGYHHEAFKNLWLSGFMAGGTDRAHQIISETNHNPKNFTDLHWWNKFWKMLDVGIKKSVALNGQFRGVTEIQKDEIVKMHKVNIVRNFIYGLETLPQWEEWQRQEIALSPTFAGESQKPQLTNRIIKVANEALKINGVTFKIEKIENVLNNKL